MFNPFISKLGRFARLSKEDKSVLGQLAHERVRQIDAHEDIIREGEKPEHIRLIVEGWACRYKMLEDGRRQIVAFFLPGDLCDLNVFILRQMDHSIGTITRTAVAEISRTNFETLTLSVPRITQALWWENLVTSAIQREWALNLGQRSAFERMAHLFCELFVRLETVGLTSGNSCDMPLTQLELGEATGMSAVHVNRTLQELRAENLIELRSRRLVIPDMEALRRTALFNANYLHLDHEGRHLDANEE
ncbi:MAG: cyclic nucleotide-binding protein [Mesorhizobium amorphae]|nr:MAG: cyclic nucleotide-binding protein [Mesorhizobium amorphae]